MKVLSYLEYSNKGGIVDVALQIEKLGWDGGVTDFFAQQFKPEMITELFEGWIINRLEQFANLDYKINIYDRKKQIEYNNGNYIYYFAKPRTLDDFINDCERAGIELQWKEQS